MTVLSYPLGGSVERKEKTITPFFISKKLSSGVRKYLNKIISSSSSSFGLCVRNVCRRVSRYQLSTMTGGYITFPCFSFFSSSFSERHQSNIKGGVELIVRRAFFFHPWVVYSLFTDVYDVHTHTHSSQILRRIKGTWEGREHQQSLFSHYSCLSL